MRSSSLNAVAGCYGPLRNRSYCVHFVDCIEASATSRRKSIAGRPTTRTSSILAPLGSLRKIAIRVGVMVIGLSNSGSETGREMAGLDLADHNRFNSGKGSRADSAWRAGDERCEPIDLSEE